MKYRKLNEVLIEWNESSKEGSDNVFLKSEDIKRYFDNRYFIYRLDEKGRITIFGDIWPEFKKYRDKVWINNKHVELNNDGRTADKFESGEYRVYIEDIDKVTDMTYMFYDCKQLVSAFIPDSVTHIGREAFWWCKNLESLIIPNSVTSISEWVFESCYKLKTIYVEDRNNFNQIKFEHCFSNPIYYGAKVIELNK